ncbi:oligosaccharide flippase family protein [Flavobacterium sp. MAH-1]|uniref:Oligosaccharide flippase family protein n=1 Tax=Flavobacterium agri TaxID=2743471 RepID=A0A7Y8Y0B2_9FLAO|nr:oligosaccharide flippase family protein [Flavobacterium agri]NUY80138.1 oligosaccharide flippase family protein [Flavobacterium agri]NYA70163.1 oligosaccharide flippase family protein [Flavobacterium agri]
MLKSRIHNLAAKNTNLVIYGVGQVINLVVPLLAVPHIVAVCGEAAYGKVGVALAISFFLIVIIDYGSDMIGVKEVAVNRDSHAKLSQIFATAYSARLLLLLGVLAMGFLVFGVLPAFSAERKLYLYASPILVAQAISPIWFLQGIERFRLITALTVISKAIYLFGVLYFVSGAGDYIYVNLWWGLGMFFPYLAGFLYCSKLFGFKFADVRRRDIADFLSDNFRFLLSQMFLSVKNYSPIIVITLLGGFAVGGQFKIIEQIILPFRSYLQMFFRYFYPKLCFEIFQDRAQGFRYWKQVSGFNLALVFVLVFGIFLFPSEILHFFKVSEQNTHALSDALRLGLLIPMLIACSYSLEQLMLSLGKKELYIRLTFVTVVLNLLLMTFLFWSFALNGLISSLIISEMILIVLIWLTLKNQFKPQAHS